MSRLAVGVIVKEIITTDVTWRNARILHSDEIGIAFEVERTVHDEASTVELAVTQVFLPWTGVKAVIIVEQVI